jgi:hypothetical protein
MGGVLMANYIDRCLIVIPAGALAQANAAADNWEIDTGRGKTFGACRLSVSGSLPAQAYAACTRATAGMKTRFLELQSPNFKIYFESDGWTIKTALADVGLTKIRGTMT